MTRPSRSVGRIAEWANDVMPSLERSAERLATASGADDLPRPPRSVPPRVVDAVILALVALAYAGFVLAQVFVHGPQGHQVVGPAVWTSRETLAVVCFPSVAALWWRRRRPLAVLAISLLAMVVAYPYPSVFVLVALFAVASRGTPRTATIAWLSTGASILIGSVIAPGSGAILGQVVSSFALAGAVAALGMYVGAHGAYMAELRERALFAKALAAFLPPDVARMVERSPSALSLDEEVEATVLFSDVRGFSALAERLPPREVATLMNEHLSAMAAVVTAHGGTVDKFVGDGLMAVFGVPVHADDHPERALAAAVEMQRRQAELNNAGRGDAPPLQIGIGVNTGTVIAGTVGGAGRLEYTVFGDAVNVAQRLQTEAAADEILVAASTAALVRSARLDGAGTRQLKGRSRPVDVYSVSWAGEPSSVAAAD